MSNKMSTLLLTGFPGVGKTTIIKKLAKDLQKKSINFVGFYTEEVRNEKHERIGFDIRTFDGRHSILARNPPNLLPNATTDKRVGKYHVYIENFDAILDSIIKTDSQLIVIDEIGGMELLSNSFQSYMESVIESLKTGKTALIATIGTRVRQNNVTVQLNNLDGIKLFSITKQNRNQMYPEILEEAMKIIKR